MTGLVFLGILLDWGWVVWAWGQPVAWLFPTWLSAFLWAEHHIPLYWIQWCHFNPVTGRFDYCT